MGRHSEKQPVGATVVKHYDQFEELIENFADGNFDLLTVVGRPGLSKSQLLRRATANRQALIIKGRKSPIDFYTDLYFHRDMPIILDDADDLTRQKLCREYVKALTETDRYKRLDYGTKTKILQNEGVPNFFWTKSAVCIITNYWNSSDPILQALESRAEFIYFDPDWGELYRQVADWFWDQEIFDYVHERLEVLKQPDCRLFVKAYQRKQAGMKRMPWQAVIDSHVDDALGIIVRQLMRDESYKKNTDRAKAFSEVTGANRATYYRRLADISRHQPTMPVPRLLLTHTSPPEVERPADGLVADPSDGSDEHELRATVR